MGVNAGTEEKRTLTIPEAARLLGISRNGAYQAAHLGQLPVLVFGRRLLVPIAALEKMLEEAEQPVSKD